MKSIKEYVNKMLEAVNWAHFAPCPLSHQSYIINFPQSRTPTNSAVCTYQESALPCSLNDENPRAKLLRTKPSGKLLRLVETRDSEKPCRYILSRFSGCVVGLRSISVARDGSTCSCSISTSIGPSWSGQNYPACKQPTALQRPERRRDGERGGAVTR